MAINSRGYTDELYESCGSPRCTTAILEAVGVGMDGLDASEIHTVSAGNGVTVAVVSAGETDYDVWCAACGEFLHHGLECDCAADEDGTLPDRDPHQAPHINLKDAPSIAALWR
ncbi:hypothetical protein H7J07_05310 [Mycobacterium koreense]|nr:hypothetical protein [Mycolicibacillus koreensis]MCV7247642.1 hypothetical protein [Mycolicibacillus koreensis]